MKAPYSSTYHVPAQIRSLIAVFLFSIFSYALSASGQPTYDLFISAFGSDGNNGTSAVSPVQSIQALENKAITFGRGVKIKFLDATHHRAFLNLSSLDDLEIDGGFSTLDAADIASKNLGLWMQPDIVTYPNVWKISWATDVNIREGYTMLINGEMPGVKTNLANVNNTENSFYMPLSELNGPSPIDIFIHSTTNPNTNASQYEIMKRYEGLSAGGNSVISNFITRTQINNDGSGVERVLSPDAKLLKLFTVKEGSIQTTFTIDELAKGIYILVFENNKQEEFLRS